MSELTALTDAQSAIANRIELLKPTELKMPEGYYHARYIISAAPKERDLIVSALRLAAQTPDLAAQLAAARSALEKAATWLEGWASAEPYLSEIRSTLSTLAQEPAGQSVAGSASPGVTDEPVVWVIPGDDNARANGSIDAMAWQEGEFSRPLFAHPTVKVSGDAAEMRERAAKLCDEAASYERDRIKRAKADKSLSETTLNAVIVSCVTRETTAQDLATTIRALPLTQEGRS